LRSFFSDSEDALKDSLVWLLLFYRFFDKKSQCCDIINPGGVMRPDLPAISLWYVSTTVFFSALRLSRSSQRSKGLEDEHEECRNHSLEAQRQSWSNGLYWQSLPHSSMPLRKCAYQPCFPRSICTEQPTSCPMPTSSLDRLRSSSHTTVEKSLAGSEVSS